MATIYHLLQELTPNAENFQHLIALSKQSTLNNRELKKIYNDALQARDLDTLANLMTISVDPARQMEVLKLMIKYKYNPEVVDSPLKSICLTRGSKFISYSVYLPTVKKLEMSSNA